MERDAGQEEESVRAPWSGRRILRAARYVAAGSVGAIAAFLLASWLSGMLSGAGGGLSWSTAPVSSLLFLMAAAVALLRLSVDPPRGRTLVLAAAAVMAAITSIVLIGVETELSLSPGGSALAYPGQTAGAYQAGHMSPGTAVVLVAVAIAIALFESGDVRIRTAAVHLSFAVSGVGFVLLVGYAYGAPLLYGGAVKPVSLPAAAALFLIGVALSAAGHDVWPIRAFLGDSIRARLNRILVPLTVLPVLGLMLFDAAMFRSGYREDPVAFALFFLATQAVVVLIVFRVASATGNRLDAAEQELRRSESQLLARTAELERSNRDLEEFAYVASHDLQEPLRMVSAFADLLRQRYAGRLDEDADQFIGYAVRGARRMQELIQDLLDYSRVESKGGPLRPADLGAVLEDALGSMRDEIAGTGAVVTFDALPVVACDADQIGRVFKELVDNAIKFRSEAPPKVHVGVREYAGGWEFRVSDNGIGIEPAYADRVFRLFERLDTSEHLGGTGMGLTLCKRIVERHRGRIRVEPAAVGAVVAFTLPREALAAGGAS